MVEFLSTQSAVTLTGFLMIVAFSVTLFAIRLSWMVETMYVRGKEHQERQTLREQDYHLRKAEAEAKATLERLRIEKEAEPPFQRRELSVQEYHDLLPDQPPVPSYWLHRKTGSIYEVLAVGWGQSSDPVEAVVVYNDVNGIVHTRVVEEFLDGRFLRTGRAAWDAELNRTDRTLRRKVCAAGRNAMPMRTTTAEDVSLTIDHEEHHGPGDD